MRELAGCRWNTIVGVAALVACEARPTAPQAAEVAPPVVVPPTPAELPAPVVAEPPPAVAVPPAPALAPGQIAMYPILRHRSRVTVAPELTLRDEARAVTAGIAALLDDQVVFVIDGERFAVFPTGAAAEATAPPDLVRKLPTDPRAPLTVRDDPDSEGAVDIPDDTRLTALGGRWPAAMFVTTEAGNTRSYSLPQVLRWDRTTWEGVVSEVYKDPDVGLELAWGYLRLFAWVDGGMLGVRGLVCGTDISECEDGVLDLEMQPEYAELAAKVRREYAEFKPLAIVEGRETALPGLPKGGDTARLLATASGDIFVPRAGAVERWSVATGEWHTLPLADAAAIATLYGRDPAHLYALSCSGEAGGLARLVGDAFVAIDPPPGACLAELSIELGGAVWALQGAPGEIGASAPPDTALWRRPVDGAWERVTIVPAPIAADRDGRWTSDGLRWTRDPPASGTLHAAPFAVVAIGPGDVFVHAKIVETGDMVVLRDRPLPAPTIDLAPTQIAGYRMESGAASCLPQQLVLGSFDRPVELAEVWPQALAEVARTPGGRLFEVPSTADTWRLVAMIDGPPHDTPGKRVLLHGLRGRLLPSGPDMKEPTCGLPDMPRREHVAAKP